MVLEVQNNPFPSVLMVEAADETDPAPDALPAPGQQRLIVGPDHLLYLLDDAGVATQVGGAVGAIATDSIWDAAGDLVQGSGANTGAKLSAGTAGMFLKSAGAAAANLWAFPQGHELDYAEITTGTTHTATSAATATTSISGNAVAYDGSTRVKIEFWTAGLEAPPAANASIVLELYDGATDLGRIAIATAPAANQHRGTGYGVRFLTPSAATHTYHIKGWVTSSTGAVAAGAGGAGVFLPAWLRITKA